MKTLITRTFVAFVLCVMTSALVLADTTIKDITFDRDVMLNGTLVKKGTYKAVFDDKTNELSIVKGKKTVATAPARLEKQAGNPRSILATKQGSNVLHSITMKDGNQATVLDAASASTGDKATTPQ